MGLYVKSWNARRLEIFMLRNGLHDGVCWTLEEVGQKLGITRERVRQLEKKPYLWDSLGRALRNAIWDDIRAVTERNVWVFRLAGGLRASWPYAFVAKTFGCELVELPNGCWAILRPHLKSNPLTTRIREQPRFYTLEEAEPLTTLNAYELIHVCSVMDRLFVTQGGLVGSHKWTLLDWVEAIATQLAQNGVYEWHFSQMAKLMSWLNPEEYGSMTERNVAAALARSDSRFQNAGLNGVWRLDSLGDGFEDTKEAALYILERARRPLHHTEIYSQLARPVRPGTLTALLSREPEFVNLGEGHYGLTAQHYLLSPAPPYSSRTVVDSQHFDLPRISVIPRISALSFGGFILDISPIEYQMEAGQLFIGGERAVSRPTRLDDPSPANHLLFWLLEFDGVDAEAHLNDLVRLCAQAVDHLRQIMPENRIRGLLEQHSYALAHLIFERVRFSSQVEPHFEVKVADGLEPLKPGLRRTSKLPADFKAEKPVTDGWREFTGFERCVYPVQVLDGASDLELAGFLERESVRWFRPVHGQFPIYRSETSEEQHQPDFVAEFSQANYLIDLAQTGAVSDLTRQAALREWCRQATARGGIPWRYTRLTITNLSDELRQLF